MHSLPQWPLYIRGQGLVDPDQTWHRPDAWPDSSTDSGGYLANQATRAFIYGSPVVQQYALLHQFTVDPSTRSLDLGEFLHDEMLADSRYSIFTTPNVDTLYSNAWLDLSAGPVELNLPDFDDRYFTAQFLDAHCTSTNISPQTGHSAGGRFIVGLPEDLKNVEGEKVVVDTPDVWLLLRIQALPGADIHRARALQEHCSLRRLAPSQRLGVSQHPTHLPAGPSGVDFWAVLDGVLRRNGVPLQDAGFVHAIRTLYLRTFADSGLPLSLEFNQALDEGVERARTVIMESVHARGVDMGNGWRALTSGTYGVNYLHRATTNYVGLGGTTREENAGFVCHTSLQGHQLNGRNSYSMTFVPPQVNGFWSLVTYSLEDRTLPPVSAHEVAIRGDGTSSFEPIHVHLATDPPSSAAHHWLPVPGEDFYVVLRCYGPSASVIDMTYRPAPIAINY